MAGKERFYHWFRFVLTLVLVGVMSLRGSIVWATLESIFFASYWKDGSWGMLFSVPVFLIGLIGVVLCGMSLFGKKKCYLLPAFLYGLMLYLMIRCMLTQYAEEANYLPLLPPALCGLIPVVSMLGWKQDADITDDRRSKCQKLYQCIVLLLSIVFFFSLFSDNYFEYYEIHGMYRLRRGNYWTHPSDQGWSRMICVLAGIGVAGGTWNLYSPRMGSAVTLLSSICAGIGIFILRENETKGGWHTEYSAGWLLLTAIASLICLCIHEKKKAYID